LFHIGLNSPQKALDRFARTVLKIDYVLPDGITLRSVSGYQRARGVYVADLDGTSFINSYFEDEIAENLWSEEINVISPAKGFFTWIVGAYADRNYNDFLSPYRFVIRVPAGNLATEYLLQGTNPVPSKAAFAQLSFQLSAAFQLQIGARYTDSQTP